MMHHPAPILVLLFLFAPGQTLEAYKMKIVKMDGLGDNQCRKHLEKQETAWSGFIFSHELYPGPYPADKNCFLMLKAPEGYRIRLTAMEFTVNGHPNECKKDTLHIFDQEETASDIGDGPGAIVGQFCGKLKNGTVLATSTYNYLTLWWHTDSELPLDHLGRGFKLLWTIFRDQPPGGCSQVNEFQCTTGHCIPANMACDNTAHCQDKSDLDARRQRKIGCANSAINGGDGYFFGGISDGALAGICIGTVLGSVLLCVGLIICCRDACRKRRSQNFNAESYSAPVGEPGPPRTNSTSPTYKYSKPYSQYNSGKVPIPHRSYRSSKEGRKTIDI